MSDLFKQFLRQQGQSVTEQRVAVYEFVAANDPTTVAAVVAAQAQAMDRASIYRTLKLFRELGVVQDIVTGGRRMIELTDQFDAHHHHLSCRSCGAMRTIEDEDLESRLDAIARAQGFEPDSHHLEVTGLCADCRAGRRKTP